jgi:hypothetical protein
MDGIKITAPSSSAAPTMKPKTDFLVDNRIACPPSTFKSGFPIWLTFWWIVHVSCPRLNHFGGLGAARIKEMLPAKSP